MFIDWKEYVNALVLVHTKNSENVERSFYGEAGFVASLNKAYCKFVNRNAATGTSSNNKGYFEEGTRTPGREKV